MTRKIRLVVLGLATALNLAALTVVHTAMIETHVRSELANLQPVRIVVTESRSGNAAVAMRTCPAPTVL